jgi:hypothetical protein
MMELTPGYHVLYSETLEGLEKQVEEIRPKAQQFIFVGGVTTGDVSLPRPPSLLEAATSAEKKRVFMQAIFFIPGALSGLVVASLGAKAREN